MSDAPAASVGKATGKQLLPVTWKVPELFRARLGDSVGRQRAMAAEGHLLLVLHAPPLPEDDHREGRFFWRDPAGNWKSSANGAGVQAMKNHLAECAARIDALDNQLERSATADDYYQVLQAAAPLHRCLQNLHGTLQQAREMAGHDREMISLRDESYDLARGADLLHADAKNSLDVTVARQVEEQSRQVYQMTVASHRLNVLVALFFPLATLSALFGMNVLHGLESKSAPWTFLGVIGIGLLSGLLLAAFVARRPELPKPRLPDRGKTAPSNTGPRKSARQVRS